MRLINTTTIQVERALYAFYTTFLEYCKNEISPINVVWTTISGYFPGFELKQQITDAPTDENILMPSVTMMLNHQSIEIESKVNYPWRQLTQTTDTIATRFYTPIISLPDANLRVKFLMYHGTFEVIISSFSPLYAQDVGLRFQNILNNRYSYLPSTFPLTIPLQIINENDSSLYQELITQQPITLAYMPSTGQTQYYITLNLRPLLKLTSSTFTVVNETMYQNTLTFEYLAQLPTAWLFWIGSPVSYVNLKLSTPQLTALDYLAALVNPTQLGFTPRGYVILQSLDSVLQLPNFNSSMPNEFTYTSLTVSASGTNPVQTSVITSLDPITGLFNVDITITDPNYVNNTQLLQTQPVVFYWGIT